MTDSILCSLRAALSRRGICWTWRWKGTVRTRRRCLGRAHRGAMSGDGDEEVARHGQRRGGNGRVRRSEGEEEQAEEEGGAPKESAREKKRSEKVSTLTCVLAHACVQLKLFVDFVDGFCGLMRAGEEGAARFNPRRVTEVEIYSSFLHLIFVEKRRASFKPIMHAVKKPISSVLEKIRLHKLEILEKFSGWYVMFPGGYFNGLLMILLFFAIHFRTNTPVEDSDDDASEPESDSTGHLGCLRLSKWPMILRT
jgi:hypothetical protein